MRMMRNLIERCSMFLMILTTLCISMMMINIVMDVSLRAVFDAPIPATSEISAYYYMVAAVFLPLPLVELRNESIRVDLVYNLASDLYKRFLDLFSYTTQFIFFSIIFWQTAHDAFSAFEKRDFIDSQIQLFIWPGRFFLPLGFGLAALVSVLKLIDIFFSSSKESPIDRADNAQERI